MTYITYDLTYRWLHVSISNIGKFPRKVFYYQVSVKTSGTWGGWECCKTQIRVIIPIFSVVISKNNLAFRHFTWGKFKSCTIVGKSSKPRFYQRQITWTQIWSAPQFQIIFLSSTSVPLKYKDPKIHINFNSLSKKTTQNKNKTAQLSCHGCSKQLYQYGRLVMLPISGLNKTIAG